MDDTNFFFNHELLLCLREVPSLVHLLHDVPGEGIDKLTKAASLPVPVKVLNVNERTAGEASRVGEASEVSEASESCGKKDQNRLGIKSYIEGRHKNRRVLMIYD